MQDWRYHNLLLLRRIFSIFRRYEPNNDFIILDQKAEVVWENLSTANWPSYQDSLVILQLQENDI